ncbi:hypothetical protein AY511_08515 [Corynebacterium diphtheriae bv. mitis]|nr:hypothetical protein AY511_08515 [Corynebacterium diphtheriae bv. mitis]OWO45816.1 hypothetical protein AY545_03280 [Corynebacterium belfantii]OWO61899.1 hypothetical protein AY477_10410 [Corynebacterium diphtheriae bv. mitis]
MKLWGVLRVATSWLWKLVLSVASSQALAWADPLDDRCDSFSFAGGKKYPVVIRIDCERLRGEFSAPPIWVGAHQNGG